MASYEETEPLLLSVLNGGLTLTAVVIDAAPLVPVVVITEVIADGVIVTVCPEPFVVVTTMTLDSVLVLRKKGREVNSNYRSCRRKAPTPEFQLPSGESTCWFQ